MKHLSFDVLLVAPIPLHATTPDPGGPCIIWSSINSCLLTWTGTEWGSMVFDPELMTLENMNTYGFVVRDSNTGSFDASNINSGILFISVSNPTQRKDFFR